MKERKRNIESAKIAIAKRRDLRINSKIVEQVILVTQKASKRLEFPDNFSLDNLMHEIERLSPVKLDTRKSSF